MSGFSNPIIGGGGTLVYPAIKSPNFVAGVSGWSIDKDGNAYFNELEALGTIISIEELDAGQWFKLELAEGGVTWYYGSSEDGPWTTLGGLAAGLLSFPDGYGPLLDLNMALQVGNEFWLPPSGDTSGATDAANIAAAYALGCLHVHLLPGTFYVDAAINMDTDYQTIEGSPYGFGSVIESVATSDQTGIIVLGSTADGVSQPRVANLALKGNAYAGHGIVSRAENPCIENVFVQDITGDGLHFSWDGLATTYLDSANVSNVTVENVTGRGCYIDTYLTESEFYALRLSGPTEAPDFGGTYGIENSGHAIKFVNCHPFGFADGGYYGNADTHTQITGGSYESNGGPHIAFDGSTGCKATGFTTYFSTTFTGTVPDMDVHVYGQSSWIEISACTVAGGSSNAGVELNDVSQVTLAGVQVKPSPFNSDLPAHAIENDAGSGSSYLTVDHCTVQGPGTGASTIAIGGATHSIVNACIVTTADDIIEGTGGDYNIFTSNIAAAVSTVGTHTVAANNVT